MCSVRRTTLSISGPSVTRAGWPVNYTVTAEPGLEVVFEGLFGGRIFERTPSGREVEWGEITVCDSSPFLPLVHPDRPSGRHRSGDPVQPFGRRSHTDRNRASGAGSGWAAADGGGVMPTSWVGKVFSP